MIIVQSSTQCEILTLRVKVSNWDTAGVRNFLSFFFKTAEQLKLEDIKLTESFANRSRYKVKQTLVPNTTDNNVMHALIWRARGKGRFGNLVIFVTVMSNSSILSQEKRRGKSTARSFVCRQAKMFGLGKNR